MIKKLICNLIIVGVLVLVLDFVLGRSLRYYYFKQSSGFLYRTTYSIEKTEADILVFGSSRANHHYVPEVFEDSLNMTFYNTGRERKGILFQTAILKSVLKRFTPKLIILDYYGDFEKNETNDNLSSLLPYYRTNDEIKNLILSNNSLERIKTISKIYPFNSQIFSILIGNLEFNKNRFPENKGYVPLYVEWKSMLDSNKVQSYDINPGKVNDFRDFLKIVKKSGSKFIVIFSPIFETKIERRDIEICKDICSNENILFLDYSKDTLFLNNGHLFQDVLHLNQNGAKIFSILVADTIKKTFYKK